MNASQIKSKYLQLQTVKRAEFLQLPGINLNMQE